MKDNILRYKKGKYDFDIFNPIKNILLNKGIKNEDIDNFIRPNNSQIESENLFETVEYAEKMLEKALKYHYKIAILFDCDVDGYTSGSIMYQVCNQLGLHTDIIVHDDKEHGLDDKTMERVQELQPNLLIIPDAGSNDLKQIHILLMNKINVLILDHHEIEVCNNELFQFETHITIVDINNVNETYECVIMNNQSERNIKDKAMTGVGVTYKFIKYLENNGHSHLNADKYLDLVAVGMIADVCDLTQLQSRYYVQEGINRIKSKLNDNYFIKYIYDKINYNICGIIDITTIAFKFVPLINSLIRFGTYEEKILLAKAISNVQDKISSKDKNDISIQEYVYKLCNKYQKEQKKTVDDNMKIINEQISKYNLNETPVLVCNAKDMDKNLLGLMATKVSGTYHKPSIIMRNTGSDLYSGSARGFGVNSFKDLCEKSKLFDKTVGHDNAFGVSIEKNNISKLYEYVKTLEFEPFIYSIEEIFQGRDLNLNIVKSVADYDFLWGCGIEKPKFVVENINVDKKNIHILGENNNSIRFISNGITYVKFNCEGHIIDKLSNLKDNDYVLLHIIGSFAENRFNGSKSYQVVVDEIDLEEIPF